MLKWKKKGLIFKPDGRYDWMQTHAQVPTALVKEDRIRVYFATRNAKGKSLPGYIDLDKNDPSKILYLHDKPIISFGNIGTFDDEGVMPNDVREHDGKVYMFYSGWNQGVTVPYRNSMGLMISEDGGDTFQRAFEGPIMDRTAVEPHIAVTPSVLIENGLWRMWYVSGLRWVEVNGKYEPVYVIKYAESKNGIRWDRPNILCIPQTHEMEAHSCPCVIKIGNKYHMWFSFRDSNDYRNGTGSYRIGYAQSKDGIKWERDDNKAGITTSEEGWDSKMLCYANIVKVGDKYNMFYNGNGFGQSGLGYAICEEKDIDN